MPPRLPRSARVSAPICCHGTPCPRSYATIIDSPPSTTTASAIMQQHPRTQPPSHKPPELRKSQLLRSYASLLRSSPLLLLFQHNNLRAIEWIGLRGELAIALRRVDAAEAEAKGTGTSGLLEAEGLADQIKIQIIQTGIFGAALKVVEYFQMRQAGSANMDKALDTLTGGAIPPGAPPPPTRGRTSPSPSKRSRAPKTPTYTHALSADAHQAVRALRRKHALDPLLSGPLVVLSFPRVSPAHLKAALQIVAPHAAEGFPAPTRRASPGWHDAPVQAAVAKLMPLAGRVEGRVVDLASARRVAHLDGGLDGQRAALVRTLQGAAAGLANVLDAAARSVYFALEGRRMALEEEGKVKGEDKEQEKAAA